MARKPTTDRTHLEFHHGTYRVSVTVPPSLRAKLGKTKLKRPLRTDSLIAARAMKHRAVAELKQVIEDARDGANGGAYLREAVELSRYTTKATADEELDELGHAIRQRMDDIIGPEVAVANTRDGPEPVYDRARVAQAEIYREVAWGRATPVGLHHAAYLATLKVKPRTKADDVRALALLTEWCAREGVPATLEAITDKKAYHFADALGVMTGGLNYVTQNKYLGRLGRYWQYLVKRTPVERNVFQGVKVEGVKTPHEEQERPFEDEEIRRLLIGPAKPHMKDLMMLGALTGARLEAIVDLKVKDVLGDVITFKAQKKEPAPRDIPIHPALGETLERRIAGKGPGDDLFPEWPKPKKADSMRERSSKASNHFTAYRKEVGVHHVIEGRRRALTNFHSFRRWFITKMERAGVPENLIAAIVGHQMKGITLGLYSGGPEMVAAREAIARIALPPLDAGPIPMERALRPRHRDAVTASSK